MEQSVLQLDFDKIWTFSSLQNWIQLARRAMFTMNYLQKGDSILVVIISKFCQNLVEVQIALSFERRKRRLCLCSKEKKRPLENWYHSDGKFSTCLLRKLLLCKKYFYYVWLTLGWRASDDDLSIFTMNYLQKEYSYTL